MKPSRRMSLQTKAVLGLLAIALAPLAASAVLVRQVAVVAQSVAVGEAERDRDDAGEDPAGTRPQEAGRAIVLAHPGTASVIRAFGSAFQGSIRASLGK